MKIHVCPVEVNIMVHIHVHIHKYGLVHGLQIAYILTAMDKSADIPPLLYSCRSRAVILPSLVKPTLYLLRNGCLPPELSMSSFRSNMILTGCRTL